MIRLVLCGFALGAWSLQFRATLPSIFGLVGYLGGGALAAVAAVTARCRPGYISFQSIQIRHCIVYALTLTAAYLAGYSWATWRASIRLAHFLPHALEGQDIGTTGIIRGIPILDTRHTRFVFEIEHFTDPEMVSRAFSNCNTTRSEHADRLGIDVGKTSRYQSAVQAAAPPRNDTARIKQYDCNAFGKGIQSMPRFVQLNWYARADAPPPRLSAGERWQLTIRLKRPHGNANPHGTDSEASMLERNLRAIGTVRANPTPKRMAYHAHTLAIALARWRETVQYRIAKALNGAPHTGILIALATGVQSMISINDWRRFTRTGTNHLVAISGLHISLLAGLAALLAGSIWRRLPLFGRAGPLWIATPRVQALAGAGAGVLYAALAGFGVPAQRACVMLIVVASALISGRNVASSVVLAWALAVIIGIDPWAVTSAGFWLSFGAVAIILTASSTPCQRQPNPHRAHPLDGHPVHNTDKKYAQHPYSKRGVNWPSPLHCHLVLTNLSDQPTC